MGRLSTDSRRRQRTAMVGVPMADGSGKSRSGPVLCHLRRRRRPRESRPPPAPSTPLARLLFLVIETG
ncbi:hypothetical protein TIFTF001_019749 [Ficus carica]|uniref:Uncharacterized protein n=1 Tax=Ficus carica TaxID=3494 RepID=A0AA88AE30_FICCA|nr:hypothetical protein TIFTF001_019749 [Ficus carica]